MINYTAEQLAQWVKESKESADQLNYEWDVLAVNWPLTEKSVVLEVGSYKGRWALQIARRYNPILYCFEPQPWAAAVSTAVLEGFNAHVFNYGLADYNGTAELSHAGTDGASLYGVGEDPLMIHLVDIAGVLRDLRIDHIDLMLMNIEGYEHTLLPYMFRCGIFPQRLMVQCHSFPGMSCDHLRTIIAGHYRSLWDFGSVLSAWER